MITGRIHYIQEGKETSLLITDVRMTESKALHLVCNLRNILELEGLKPKGKFIWVDPTGCKPDPITL